MGLIGAAFAGFVFFGTLEEFAELGEGAFGRRGRGGGAEAAVAALILGGAEGALGAREEGGGVVGFRGHDGGNADRDRAGGQGGVVHGFDDLLADMVRAGRRGMRENGDEDAGGLRHDDVAVTGAVDADGAFEVGGAFRVGAGVGVVERDHENCEGFPFGGAAVPLLAEFLLEWRHGCHGVGGGQEILCDGKERARVRSSSSGMGCP